MLVRTKLISLCLLRVYIQPSQLLEQQQHLHSLFQIIGKDLNENSVECGVSPVSALSQNRAKRKNSTKFRPPLLPPSPTKRICLAFGI